MKIPGIGKKHRIMKHTMVTIMVVVLLTCFSGVALCVSESGGHEAKPKGWIATDTYRVMNFAVLAIVLFLLLRKPVSQALNSRIKGIHDQLSELEAKKKNAEAKLAEYQKKLSSLDKEAEKIIAEYIKQGNDAKERILKEAQASAEKLEEQAKRMIAHEFAQAKTKLQEEILERSLIMAEEIIKSRINETDQERLVDEFLKKVVA